MKPSHYYAARVHLAARRPIRLITIATIVALAVRVTPGRCQTAAQPQGASVASATQHRVIDAVLALLREQYVDSSMANRMGQLVHDRQQQGAYDRPVPGEEFAGKLTADLRTVSHDKHIVVNFAPESPAMPAAPTPSSAAIVPDAALRRDQYLNFGFPKLERLRGNIGVMEISVFINPAEAGPTLEAAMRWLANTDALIIDLRDNDGGSPNMVSLLTSYFIDTTAELTGVYSRSDHRLHQQWTLPYVGGPKYLDKPVMILTSRDGTVSAAEAFTYNMVTLHRATAVGDTTAGAANPGYFQRIDSQFVVFVPTGRAVNPTTGTSWEGVGIAPDVAVDSRRALDVAYDSALQALLRRASSAAAKASLQEILDQRRLHGSKP